MKLFIPVLLCLLLAVSCKSHSRKSITIASNTVSSDPVLHDSLSVDQLEKIKSIQSTFREVYPVTLEETIADFKKETDVNGQIEIWLKMSNAYEKYVNSKKELDISRKKEVFAIILSRSMMDPENAVANANIKLLSPEDVREILSYCNF